MSPILPISKYYAPILPFTIRSNFYWRGVGPDSSSSLDLNYASNVLFPTQTTIAFPKPFMILLPLIKNGFYLRASLEY